MKRAVRSRRPFDSVPIRLRMSEEDIARFADGVPDWYGKDLFPGDLERLLPHVEAAQRRVPALEQCGIKDIVNGPISYTPDGSPLIGPAWGKRGLWLNEGHSFGITAACRRYLSPLIQGQAAVPLGKNGLPLHFKPKLPLVKKKLKAWVK